MTNSELSVEANYQSAPDINFTDSNATKEKKKSVPQNHPLVALIQNSRPPDGKSYKGPLKVNNDQWKKLQTPVVSLSGEGIFPSPAELSSDLCFRAYVSKALDKGWLYWRGDDTGKPKLDNIIDYIIQYDRKGRWFDFEKENRSKYPKSLEDAQREKQREEEGIESGDDTSFLDDILGEDR